MGEEINELVKMTGICKSFPGVKALSNVDFVLRHGEIHSLVGQNGAGKSTLIKVLTGVEMQNQGDIYLEGQKICPKSTLDAQSLGISTVYQEVNLCSNLSVAENIFIGREPMRHCRVDWREIKRRSEMALARLNIKLDVTCKLNDYSVGVQQMVAIARALDISSKVLILDEPTSCLDKNEVANLFQVMRKLKAEGIGIIFITHFIDQIYEVTDRITVLRNGELVGEYETAKLPRLQLISKMIGKEFKDFEKSFKKQDQAMSYSTAGPFYKAKQIGHQGTINPLDIEIYKGEVMGLAGLLGSGRTETARVIFGIDKSDGGKTYIKNENVIINSPKDSIKIGMGYCPENRKTEGIIPQLTLRENIILALQGKKRMLKNMSRKQQEEITERYIKLLNISTPGTEQLVENLSGGNQQKVILARWLATDPEFLILDEPTRGIDVETKVEIQKLVLKLSAEEGMAILFISSELEEMDHCCNRLAVFRDRQKIAELCGDEACEQGVMRTIAGGCDHGTE